MSTEKHAKIVSNIPGRTRFKVPAHLRNHQDMTRVAVCLQAHPDLDYVERNVHTGSILVHYDPECSTLEDIKEIMCDLGLMLVDVTNAELLHPHGHSDQRLDFDTVIHDLHQRVLKVTHGIIDVRFLLPLGLATLAVMQFLTYGWQLELAPWYVLAYFAVDCLIQLNSNPDPAMAK